MKKFIMAVVAIIIVTITTIIASASAEMYGKAAECGLANKNPCGILAVVNCINQLGNRQISLEEAIPTAKELGWDSSKGGMSYSQIQDLAEGIAPEGIVVKSRKLDSDMIATILSEGATVAVVVDHDALWNGKPFHSPNHIISVLEVEDDEEGERSFVISDTLWGITNITKKQLESCAGGIIYGISFRLTEC